MLSDSRFTLITPRLVWGKETRAETVVADTQDDGCQNKGNGQGCMEGAVTEKERGT